MSEVLVVLPAPLPTLTGASEHLSSFSSVASRDVRSDLTNNTNTTTTRSMISIYDRLYRSNPPIPPSIQEEERYQRMMLVLECQMEYVALVKWRSTMEAQQTKLQLRNKAECVAMQEALLQHRISRLAYLEEQYGRNLKTTTITIPITTGRGVVFRRIDLLPVIREESFEREYLGLQETQERLTIWAKLISARFLVSEAKNTSVREIYTNVYNNEFSIIPIRSTNNEENEYLLRKRISQLRHDLDRICDEAEVLSYTLDLDTQEGGTDTEDHKENNHDVLRRTTRVHYPLAVMQLAIKQMDELRTRLYRITEKQRDTEHALKSSKRRLSEEKEHAMQSQRLLNGIDELAETVASECQLRVPKREVNTIHDNSGAGNNSNSNNTGEQQEKEKEKQYFMPETYTTRVLQELRRSAMMLMRQVTWQEEKTHSEIQKRDMVLESVCSEVKKFAARIQSTQYSTELYNIANSVTIMNVAQVLENVFATIVPLMRESDTHQEGYNNIPTTTKEVASLKETIKNLRATVDLLSRENNTNHKNTNGNSGMIPTNTNANTNASDGMETSECISSMGVEGTTPSRADELTMVLRRLEELRGENIMLELALQEKQSLKPQRISQSSFLRSAVSGPIKNMNSSNVNMERGGLSQEKTDGIQTVHRLHETNTLLQHELKLERETVESLKAKLSDSERFIRELQKQCRRLRQSGRFDIHEIIHHSGSDDDIDDDDDYEESEDDDENIDDNEWINESRNDTGILHFASSPLPPPLPPAIADTSIRTSNKRLHEEKVKELSLVDNYTSQVEHEKYQKGQTSLRSASSPPPLSISSSLSYPMTSPGEVIEPMFDLERDQQITCLQDLTRLVNKLRTVHGLIVSSLSMKREKRNARCNNNNNNNNLHDIGNAFIGCGISLHTFFKPTGPSAQVSHHVAILYPLPPILANRLPARQLLYPLKQRKGSMLNGQNESTVKVFDLREEFQSSGKYLRGCMDVALSHDGRFIYALRSVDPDVLARLCSPECLDIPAERRFRFSGVLPKETNPPRRKRDSIGIHNDSNTIINPGGHGEDGKEGDTVPMDMLGWCGRDGICAWAVECLHFETPSEEARFERHLRQDYRLVLRLSADELRHFVGGSLEVMGRTAVGQTVPRLFMTVTAFEALTPDHRRSLWRWYGGGGRETREGVRGGGGPGGLVVVGMAGMEGWGRAPLRRLVAKAHWHGRRVPLATASPPRVTLQQLGIKQEEEKGKKRRYQ
ncbi:hypothetical protein LSM04_002242 [Trypanosoma melophagium]|uniref:uncharacterized protein n=1 Tax=Trypanosoma melophagium TaxID=715481 RepID=UPI003519FF30|nr:hypothetical protein LSM04_002242 [Trypanosoma melophagium]